MGFTFPCNPLYSLVPLKPCHLTPGKILLLENVRFLADAGAIILVDERLSSGVQLASVIKELLVNPQKQEIMKGKIKVLMPLAKDADILRIVESLKK